MDTLIDQDGYLYITNNHAKYHWNQSLHDSKVMAQEGFVMLHNSYGAVHAGVSKTYGTN